MFIQVFNNVHMRAVSLQEQKGGLCSLIVVIVNLVIIFNAISYSENSDQQRRRKVEKSGGSRFMIYMFQYRKIVVEAQAEDVKRRRIENCSL